MDRPFFVKKLDDVPEGANLMHRIAEGLMTPDMAAAIAAGCTFEVTMRNEGDKTIFKMQTREKVSILKYPDGKPISVIIDRR